MAIRKSTNSKSVSKAPAAAPVSSTPVRNSAVPPRTIVSSPARKSAPSHDQIAHRAYEIWQSGKGGSQDDNWFRAERELRGM
jgi:hypothetical protein